MAATVQKQLALLASASKGKAKGCAAAYAALSARVPVVARANPLSGGLAALIRFLASRPNFARLYLVEAAGVGEGMASRRKQTAERIVALLAAGREDGAAEHEPAAGIEEALVGGIVSLLARHVLAGEAERLDHFTPAVVELALAPYLGSEEARAVAARRA
jgi:hypothetical protein